MATAEVSSLTETEEILSADFAESFNIRHCIIVVDEVEVNSEKNLAYLKRFSSLKRYVIFMTETQLFEYLLEENFPDVKTAIIYKVLERENLVQFLREVKRVSISEYFH